jgi:2-C-methyl-D-erythritol 4-phosphate cytidylyltransferase
MERYVVIAAGGFGKRMNNIIPKQFLPLGKTPIIMRTIQQFVSLCDNIIVSLPEDYFDYWESMKREYNFTVPHKVVAGGETRFDSVKNAVKLLPDEGLVAIHDAARPFVSKILITRCFHKAEKYKNAIAALPIQETLRRTSQTGNKSVDREQFYRTQTPQVFHCRDIKMAYEQPYRAIFTDDSAVYEAQGGLVYLAEGDEWNFKITTPMDMFWAEHLLKSKQK